MSNFTNAACNNTQSRSRRILRRRLRSFRSFGRHITGQLALRDHKILNHFPADEMFLNNPLQHRRITLGIPRPFGVHHRNRAVQTDAQTVRLGAKHAALLGQIQLRQPRLQKVPRFERFLFVTTFGLRLVGTKEYVPPRMIYPYCLGTSQTNRLPSLRDRRFGGRQRR